MNRSIRARSSVKPDRRKLSDVARHVVLPKDIVTTGWPKVEAQARLCGIEYDDWQRQLGRCILARPPMECMPPVSAAWPSAFVVRSARRS